MLATISPASTHLDETLATLRYACQARSIVNRARINESPHDRLIRELRSEVERLKALRRDYERNSVSCTITSNESDNHELDDVKSKLSQTESKLMEAQTIWEHRFMETKETQMRELAEAEKYKAELESKVRILKTASDEITLSPYKTNFLEELEGVLTNEKENVGNIDIVNIVRNWCEERGFVCICTKDKLSIIDITKHQQTSVHLNNGFSSNLNDSSMFFDSLKWTEIANVDKKLTKTEIVASMNQIYRILSSLRPADDDNQINLIYARVNKLLQSFETALLNSVKNTKTVKWAP